MGTPKRTAVISILALALFAASCGNTTANVPSPPNSPQTTVALTVKTVADAAEHTEEVARKVVDVAKPVTDAAVAAAKAALHGPWGKLSVVERCAMLDAIVAGASGYVVKDIRGMELAEAIKAVEEKYRPFVSKAEKLESQIASMLMTNSFRGSKFATEKFAAKGQAGADVAQALFGGRFKPEGDKLVGFDASGNKLFSRSRPGELADFDEALEMIVDAYPHKEHILASNGASGGGAGGSKGGAAAGNKTVPRAQFDAMGQGERMAFFKAGGVVTD